MVLKEKERGGGGGGTPDLLLAEVDAASAPMVLAHVDRDQKNLERKNTSLHLHSKNASITKAATVHYTNKKIWGMRTAQRPFWSSDGPRHNSTLSAFQRKMR
jgi:hypothetical protein